MNTICINCPMGCPLEIKEENGQIKVYGNTCKRGETYGIEEYTHPRRAVTTLVRMKDGNVASCKTSGTVPKERIFDVVKFIGSLVIDSDKNIGDVIANNVLDLGVDVVLTGRK